MPRFVHIDIAADDPQRAGDFFAKVFDWRVKKLDGPMPYWLVDTGAGPDAGINAGIARREEASQSTTPTIEVSSADAYAGRIVAAGGTITRPKTLIPGIGHLVTFKDPDGNVFAILEPVAGDPPADD
jgi:hypothetical protein